MDTISTHTRSTSIHGIPTEILCKILSFLASTHGARDVLGKVCYQFREIVGSTGVFWSTILIKEGPSDLRADPQLWAKRALRAKSEPLTIVLDLHWRNHLLSNLRLYNNVLENFIQVAPFSRWKALRLRRLPTLPPAFAAACFISLEELELSCRAGPQSSLIKIISDTAVNLRSLKVVGGWEFFEDKAAIKRILSRVFTVDCDHLPGSSYSLSDLPGNISRLVLRFMVRPPGGLTKITHLEITYLSMSCTDECVFDSVKTLAIDFVVPAERKCRIILPRLHTLKWGAPLFENLELLSAPALETVYFTKRTSLIAKKREKLSMPVTSLYFDDIFEVELLICAMRLFPKLQNLAAILTDLPDDCLSEILKLENFLTKPDSDVHEVPQSSIEVAGDVPLIEGQKTMHAPALAQLNLTVPSFEKDYEGWYEFARFVTSNRRGSGLQITCKLEGGRIIELPDSDVFSTSTLPPSVQE